MSEDDPFSNALAQLASVTDILTIEPEYYETLKNPRREVTVSLPVKLSGGSSTPFGGAREQHNNARGPDQGGLRFLANVFIMVV